MSDDLDKKLSIKLLKTIYPELGNAEVNDIRRPDILFKENGVGVEVTKAWNSKLEGLFFADAEERIRNREKVLGDKGMLLSNGLACCMLDIDNIIENIREAISRKIKLAPKYYDENEWINKMLLVLRVDNILTMKDLYSIADELFAELKTVYGTIIFVTPGKVFLYEGDDFESNDYGHCLEDVKL